MLTLYVNILKFTALYELISKYNSAKMQLKKLDSGVVIYQISEQSSHKN